MTTSSRDGGCQCGRVRYRFEGEPVALAVCHCRECQRQSGSAFGMSLLVRRGGFRVTEGTPRTFLRKADSGRDVECAFCPDCGTRLFHVPHYLKDTLNVKPGTLDDTSWLAPSLHCWTASRQPWVSLPDGVRCVEGQP